MVRMGYARCSTDKQDLAAQCAALVRLGVAEERIHTTTAPACHHISRARAKG
jgi:hypothetical protein